MRFDGASKVADAVLFEGYLLYPYRSSAQKNQVRWQFGVLAPSEYAKAADETTFSQTELLVEAAEDAVLDVRVRFLQVQARRVEEHIDAGFAPVESLLVDDREIVTWDEGVEREIDMSFPLADLLDDEVQTRFDIAPRRDEEPVIDATGRALGRVVREQFAVGAVVRAGAVRTPGPFGAIRLRVRVENTSRVEPSTDREMALRRSLVSTHVLLGLGRGRFISLLDPPEWARDEAEACSNLHTYPVLVDDGHGDEVVLSSPIILYDHPEIAPESAGELFDGTEIDEILTLRTIALTDAEKDAARATDPRAAAIVDRVDAMPAEWLERLHGAIRSVVTSTQVPPRSSNATTTWWDPGRDVSVSPATDSVLVGSVALARGSRVRLHPGSHRADAQDMFLDGRVATVEAVLSDVDDRRYLAVSVDDDPASEILQWHGRFLYFSPDEVQPL